MKKILFTNYQQNIMFTFVIIITCYNNKHALISRFTNVNTIIIQHLKPHL